MQTLYVHIAQGSANRKLTGLPVLPAIEGVRKRPATQRDARIWVINPVAFTEAEATTPRKGRTYETCPLTCIHLPARFGGDAEQDCYADGPSGWTADRVEGIPALEAQRMVANAISDGACEAIRYGVIGDYGRTVAERALSKAFLAALRITCNAAGIPLITYTHTWDDGRPAFDTAVNASCDTIEDARRAKTKGFQPVMVARDDEHVAEIKRELGGFVCPEMAGRADGCFAGRTSRTEGKRACGGDTPLCATERSGATMILLAH